MDKLSALLHGECAAARGRRYGSLVIISVALGVLGVGCNGMTSVPAPPAPATAHIYWTDAGTNTIQRARLDGTQVEDLLPHGLIEPYGIAVAVADGKLYWTDWDGTNKINAPIWMAPRSKTWSLPPWIIRMELPWMSRAEKSIGATPGRRRFSAPI